MRFWKKLKINQKILFPIIIVSVITGALCFFYFRSVYEEAAVNNLVEKARLLISEAEAVRTFTSEQWSRKIFDKNLKNVNEILYTVPIFSAIKVAKQNAEKFHMDFKVPKFQPRNKKNLPDKREAEILKKLEDGNTNEYWEIDKQKNRITYFRPIRLTKECSTCHGDPANSGIYWGRQDGKDITGGTMENWKEGEIHGAFEIMMSLAPVQAEINGISVHLAILSVLGMGAIIACGLFISANISRVVCRLDNAALKVAGGDLTVNVDIDSEDELGELGESFNSMVLELRKTDELREEKNKADKKIEEALLHEEKQKNYLAENIDIMLHEMNSFSRGDLTVRLNAENEDEIGKLFRGFNSAVNNIKELIIRIFNILDSVHSNSNIIASNTEEMAAGAQEQSSQVTEVSAAVEEMTKTILETSRSAAAAAENAKKAGEIASVGNTAVNDTVNEMNKISEVVQQSSGMVKKLGESSQQIGEIIQVIDDIADQTNLLALNAAIEAARAGEQGRGFAIVADEVRKLAEKTTLATKEIAGMIKQIQKDTIAAIDSMELGTEEVKAGRQLANRAGTALNGITEATNKVINDIKFVAVANEEQSNTSEEISRNVDAISNVTEESARGIQQVARSTEDLNNLISELKLLLENFKIGVNTGDTHILNRV
jgi:methyl-accepting chemotaxis protein